jgi:hypothetical protein
MAHARAGGDDHPKTRDPRSQTEIRVFEIREVALVEAA